MKSIFTLLAIAALTSLNGIFETQALKLSGEPPAKNANPGDVEDKSDKEKEEQAQEIEGAKKIQADIVAKENKAKEDQKQAENAKKKAASDAVVAQQKAKEAAWSKLPLAPDGLQHWPDGRVFYTPDK